MSLNLKNFSEEEYLTLWSYFQQHIEYSQKSDWVLQAKKYSLPVDYELKKPIFNEKLPVILDLIEQKVMETYPQANHDLVRSALEKKLSDDYAVSTMFYLRELEGIDEQDISKCEHLLFYPVDDTTKLQRPLLVSLNTSLFGNYSTSGCFTPEIFLQNQSVVNGDKKVELMLRQFFVDVGLDESLVAEIWKEAEEILTESNVKCGCLLQFFDESYLAGTKPLSFLDQNTFVSFKHGVPCRDLFPSNYIQGDYTLKKGDTANKDLELRLVVDNRTTLNPFSSLRMVRYDELPPEISQKIMATIKNRLKSCQKDEVKQQRYLELLESLWNVKLCA